ncbi:MAG: anti-sigma regulatory factor [Gammaproteobacteria bacterium]|nr:anti-sigma regulatory factor [Gammaproteobacteria bacterium]MCP5195361.1 anti-sigma regulatory factor [Gammaproteobacteria bacterium]
MPIFAHVPIMQEFHIAEARRAALLMALDLGLKRTEAYYVATAVSELATNLFLHAGGGDIQLSVVARSNRLGIEVIAQDEGPGIADVALALSDGFTTSNGLGCGLPGAQRLMDEMEIDSEVGRGTRILARKWGPVLPQDREPTSSYQVVEN